MTVVEQGTTAGAAERFAAMQRRRHTGGHTERHAKRRAGGETGDRA